MEHGRSYIPTMESLFSLVTYEPFNFEPMQLAVFLFIK